ncbi:hypothetical protein PVIIG_01588 [Plasmodium vivax India VII]|nr:hypothetical protein PVIIG_01588 [Plasmodium vivax India VII]
MNTQFGRNSNNCQPEPVTVFDDDDNNNNNNNNNNNWKVRKEFYEYCEDYNTLKKSCTHSTDTCGKYYEYLEDKSNLYNEFLALNLNKHQDKYSRSYEIYKSFDPKTLLYNLPCAFEMSPDGRRKYVKTTTTNLYHRRVQPVVASQYRFNQEQEVTRQAGSHQAFSRPETSSHAGSRPAGSRQAGSRQAGSRQVDSRQLDSRHKTSYHAALYQAPPHVEDSHEQDSHEKDPYEEDPYKAGPYQESPYQTASHPAASYQAYLEPAGDALETSTPLTERATINLPLIALSVILLLLTISFTIDVNKNNFCKHDKFV